MEFGEVSKEEEEAGSRRRKPARQRPVDPHYDSLRFASLRLQVG
jgi:hypothetical protein